MTIVWRFTFNKIRLIKKSFMLIRCRYNLQCVFIICLILSQRLWAWRCLFLKRSHAKSFSVLRWKFELFLMKTFVSYEVELCWLCHSFMFSRLRRVWVLISTIQVCRFLRLLLSPLQTQQNGRAWTFWYLDTFVCWGCLFHVATSDLQAILLCPCRYLSSQSFLIEAANFVQNL